MGGVSRPGQQSGTIGARLIRVRHERKQWLPGQVRCRRNECWTLMTPPPHGSPPQPLLFPLLLATTVVVGGGLIGAVGRNRAGIRNWGRLAAIPKEGASPWLPWERGQVCCHPLPVPYPSPQASPNPAISACWLGKQLQEVGCWERLAVGAH